MRYSTHAFAEMIVRVFALICVQNFAPERVIVFPLNQEAPGANVIYIKVFQIDDHIGEATIASHDEAQSANL